MMETGKKIGIISSIILCILSVLAIGFFILVTYFMPQKIVDDTVYSNTLDNVSDEDEKFIVNINYFTNENSNGVELFEIKINNYIDTETVLTDNPNIYSKGVQIWGSFASSYNAVNDGWKEPWSCIHTSVYNLKTDNSLCFYDTQNKISARSTVVLDDNSQFRISIDNDIYLMSLFGIDRYKVDSNFFGYQDKYEVNYNLNYLIATLHNIADSVPFGSGQITQDLGKLFKFKKFENGSFNGDWLTSDTILNGKLQKNFYNYFTINIHKYKDGAQKASDSFFKIINYDSNFETVDKSKADDYFNGEQFIKLSESNFIYILLHDKTYHAELSKHSKDLLDKYPKNQVVVEINRTKLTERGIDVAEFFIDQKYKNRVVINYV